jgi:hypothetical protein
MVVMFPVAFKVAPAFHFDRDKAPGRGEQSDDGQ